MPQRAGDDPGLFVALYGIWSRHLVRAEFEASLQLAQQLLQLAERLQDQILLLAADYAMADSLFYQGELSAALDYADRALTLHRPAQHQGYLSFLIEDPGVTVRRESSYVLWLLGYPDRAVQRTSEAIALSERLSHPISTVGAYLGAGMVYSLAEAEACFQKAIEIARHQQAKSLELRAVTSLARLLRQHDKRAAAQQILAEVYGWFTEGFDTPDLKDAKALLDELESDKLQFVGSPEFASGESDDKLKFVGPSPSIAVLPFVNISNDPDNEYFCEGLAEELLNALSKIEALRVAARTSAFSFKGKETDIPASLVRSRITDFGLAVVSEELRGDDVIAGTPGYMSPEQLTGREVTLRSRYLLARTGAL